MDEAADEPDVGGYPNLIGAAWQVALARAALDMPAGVVERAALVAALQDPDGHPTWMWDRTTITSWVDHAATLDSGAWVERDGPGEGGLRTPSVVRRLIDNGIVELRGDTWRTGRLAIHRLAARAIREHAPTEALGSAAAILAHEWLLQVTGQPPADRAQLQANLRPVAELSPLTAATRTTLNALLAFGDAPTLESLKQTTEWVDFLAPYLARGGATGRSEWAEQLVGIGDEAHQLGLVDEANERWTEALGLYLQTLAETPLDDELNAHCSKAVGALHAKLGNAEQAHQYNTRAAAILERLVDAAAATDELAGYLVDLAELYETLAEPQKKAKVLSRADVLLPHDHATPLAEDRAELHVQAETWRKLGHRLGQLSRPGAAAHYLEQAYRAYQRLERSHAMVFVGRGLAHLYIGSAEWEKAETILGLILQHRVWVKRRERSGDHLCSTRGCDVSARRLR